MRNPEPRMRMLDDFNEGWIEFEDGGSKAIKGSTNALAVIAALRRQHGSVGVSHVSLRSAKSHQSLFLMPQKHANETRCLARSSLCIICFQRRQVYHFSRSAMIAPLHSIHNYTILLSKRAVVYKVKNSFL